VQRFVIFSVKHLETFSFHEENASVDVQPVLHRPCVFLFISAFDEEKLGKGKEVLFDFYWKLSDHLLDLVLQLEEMSRK